MIGKSNSTQRRPIPKNETKYLDALVRGVYAREDLKKGLVINSENFSKYFYLAIPLNKGQLSCREVFNGETLKTDLSKDEKLTIDNVDGPFDENKALRKKILERGL